MMGLGRRTVGALCDGLLLGAAAALLAAFADYGAHWLFLETWPDRGWLLVRTLATLVPLGALAGGVGLAVATLGDAALTGRMPEPVSRRATLCALLVGPGVVVLSQFLFSGGSMSRLPAREWLQALAVGILLASVVCVAAIGQRLHAAAVRSQRTGHLALLAVGLAVLIGKVDQYVLPKLYDYLHGVLTLGAWLCYAAALYLGATRFSRLARRLRSKALAVVVATAGVAALGWHVDTIDGNQNVRVAMMHPNCSHTRSALQALGPIAIAPRQRQKTAAARQRAREARQRLRRSATPSEVSGPTTEDAHVLLVTIDALRADHLGMYRYKRATSPALDALAEESVVFDHAYAPAPHSSYSLSSLMTSEYLHETLDLGHPPPEQTLASTLAAAGYHTAAFYTRGIFHTAGERLRPYAEGAYGFALHDHENRPAPQMTDRVLEEVDRIVARGEPSSLFWVHYFDVHEPYEATTFGTSHVDRYDSEILRVDAAVTRLVQEMERRLEHPVVVAITSDHGEEFREHGGVYHGSTVYEEQVRVPLVIRAPGLTPRRVSTPVETIDLAPTLLGLLGLARAPTMRGRDLRPLATGVPTPPRPVFSAVIHKKMVVRWPYKLIADLRFGLFELYDLERDPRERTNLADQKPELLGELKDEIYGWLDSLSPAPAAAQDASPLLTALDWGRLGDRRAVEPLAHAILQDSIELERRVEAARILGNLADKRATRSLLQALEHDDGWVGAEAAIALGRMYDERARDRLRVLVASEDKDIRTRAAVSLGRLRDVDAVPGLIDALWIAPNRYERDEAVRWLGRLRDPRALDPLIELLPEVRSRYLVVIAMGQIGDPRAYEPLVDVLSWERHPNVRDNVVRGLGMLGDRRALDVIAPLAVSEPTLKNVSESLIRLDAIGEGRVGGIDVVASRRALKGFSGCVAGPPLHDWNFLHRTHCTTRSSSGKLLLSVPAPIATAQGATVVLGIRRSDAHDPVEVRLTIGTTELPPITVDGKWGEHRLELPAGTLPQGKVWATVQGATPKARLAVDHLLLHPPHSAPGA